MTLMLELDPVLEAHLRVRAERSGLAVTEYLTLLAEEDMLAVRFSEKAETDREATLQAVREGIADGEAGRESSWVEYLALSHAARDARRAASV